MSIALFGCNAMGLEVARRLSLHAHDFVLVDDDEALLESARQQGFNTVRADYTNDDELRALGIGSSLRMIFCMLGEDSENVYLTISARSLDPQLKILSVCQYPDSAARLIAAGANKVVNPFEVAGAKIHELIRRPLIVDILEQTVYGQHDLNIAEIAIPEGSALDGSRLSALQGVMRHNLILLGVVDIERGSDLFIATSGVDHKLDSGDVLVVVGARDQIEALRAEVEGGASAESARP